MAGLQVRERRITQAEIDREVFTLYGEYCHGRRASTRCTPPTKKR